MTQFSTTGPTEQQLFDYARRNGYTFVLLPALPQGEAICLATLDRTAFVATSAWGELHSGTHEKQREVRGTIPDLRCYYAAGGVEYEETSSSMGSPRSRSAGSGALLLAA
jgi:hypothetical protein